MSGIEWPPNVDGEGARAPVAGQLALAAGLVPPRSLALRAPVWGVDPSTLRVAVAEVAVDGAVRWAVRSLPTGYEDEGERYYRARGELEEFVSELAQEWGAPAAVMVEEPFGAGGRTVHPSSNRMLGVVLAAFGRWRVPVTLTGPMTWKSQALGKGHGHAKKPEIMEWARQAGYTGRLQDEADAIGIATAQAIAVAGADPR